jgi:queuine tRNA-ribosyltransferase
LNFRPIDEQCDCMVCQNYTIAYLHHLFKAKETTGHILATIHNLRFMVNLMANYRKKILEGDL